MREGGGVGTGMFLDWQEKKKKTEGGSKRLKLIPPSAPKPLAV